MVCPHYRCPDPGGGPTVCMYTPCASISDAPHDLGMPCTTNHAAMVVCPSAGFADGSGFRLARPLPEARVVRASLDSPVGTPCWVPAARGPAGRHLAALCSRARRSKVAKLTAAWQRPFPEVRARSVSACTTHTPGEMDPCGLYNDTVAALRACATRGCVAATSGPASQIAATPEPMPQRTHPGAPMGFEEGADGRIATNRLWGGRSSSLKPQDTPRSSNEGSARDASMHERCVRICKSWKPDVRTSSLKKNQRKNNAQREQYS